MRRKGILVLFVVVSLSTLVVSPASPAMSQLRSRTVTGFLADSIPSDTIIWETSGNPENLDPHVNYESFGAWILFNVYETLFTYPSDSADSTPNVPLLAEDMAMSADGLNYTFTLHQGIAFHDGTPFNASCVKYNFERAMKIFDSDGPVWMFAEPILGGQAVEDAAYYFGTDSAEFNAAYVNWVGNSSSLMVMDTYTIRMRLAYKHAPFLAAITCEVGAMMSPTWVEANGGVEYGQHNNYIDTHTCGTGPYMVTEWVPNSRIRLELNPLYWRATDAKATHPYAGYCTSITIKTNDDTDSRILNLATGNSDGCYWPLTLSDLVWNRANGTSGDGTLKSKYPYLKLWCHELTYTVTYLGLNMKLYLNASGRVIKNPFALRAMREALSYTFNYETYIGEVLHGFGAQAQGPIPRGMLGHNDSLFVYGYDVKKAVQKWNDAMSAGLDEILANMSFRLELRYRQSSDREIVCSLIKDAIMAILSDPLATQPSYPLAIELLPIPSYLYLQLYMTGDLFFYPMGWYPDYADPDNYVGPFVRSTSTIPDRIGLAGSEGWNSSLVDGWIGAASHSQNAAERLVLYGKIQEAIVDQVAYVWLCQSQNFHVESARMNGYVFHPMHGPYFYTYWKEGAITTSITDMWNPAGATITLASGAVIVIFGTAIVRYRRRQRT
ncbi:MAG: hypothetical protein C4K49_07625 [Candidatus Thorarchaeota archaeon]|nr:MAG: hypothetical protein C4K49_07625 [Candidatus Thorarchaeota archaeon]